MCPHGPSTVPAAGEAGGHGQYLVSCRQHPHGRTSIQPVRLGCRCAPSRLARIPFCPLSHLCSGFKPGVSAPLDNAKFLPLRTSAWSPRPVCKIQYVRLGVCVCAPPSGPNSCDAGGGGGRMPGMYVHAYVSLRLGRGWRPGRAVQAEGRRETQPRPRPLARRPRPRLRPAGFAGWRAREPRARDRRMSDRGPGSRQRTRPPSPPARAPRAPRPRGPGPGRAARIPRGLRAMPGRP